MRKQWRTYVAFPLLVVLTSPLARTDTLVTLPPASVEQIRHGEYLAHAANCVACHSAKDGAAYAGGRGMGSPLGVMYTTNITPDPETGIGRYSEQDFAHALRDGVAKDGHHLYPSMPYPSYAKISDEDIDALFSYFMHAVKPVRAPNRPADIRWPLNMRWPLAIWNWLFTTEGSYRNDTSHDTQWNRGAYIVQGMGHCGACHTPRGWLFQEKALTDAKRVYLSGASLDNWSAADLSGDATYGLGRWSEADLLQFLRTGHCLYGTAFGSMIDVINYSTQYLTLEDNAAIAHYLKSLLPAHESKQRDWEYDPAATQSLNSLQYNTPGSELYAQQCAACHQRDGKGAEPFLPALAGNTAVLDPDAVSLINITLNGSAPVVVDGTPDAYRMVPFRRLLNDKQVADEVSYIRAAWGNHAGAVSPDVVKKLRAKTDPVHYEEIDLLRMR
jgi:alcohol dehydrogenase (quinone), cytochrome c subunit